MAIGTVFSFFLNAICYVHKQRATCQLTASLGRARGPGGVVNGAGDRGNGDVHDLDLRESVLGARPGPGLAAVRRDATESAGLMRNIDHVAVGRIHRQSVEPSAVGQITGDVLEDPFARAVRRRPTRVPQLVSKATVT